MTLLRNAKQLSYITACCMLVSWFSGSGYCEDTTKTEKTLRILVMDPLAAPLSCVCVVGHGQRDYQQLAQFLEKKLSRKVEVVFDESLALGTQRIERTPDLIIGSNAMVRFDCKRENVVANSIVCLTDKQGKTELSGLFTVRKNDPAKTIDDLKNRRLSLGPIENPETHEAALTTLKSISLNEHIQTKTFGSIDAAVFSVTDKEADVTVIPDYLPPLLEGCGKVAPGSLRSIGKTDPVPFIEVFATNQITTNEVEKIRQALLEVKQSKALLIALESKHGFIPNKETEWTDWRGPNRDGLSSLVPESLPEKLTEIWTADLTGPAMAGVAATEKFVVVPDKDKDLTTDIFRCFDAKNGKPLWTLEYRADEWMEYTNSPRATPVIDGERVYLQGAMGNLHCVNLKTGKIAWRTHFVKDFGTERINWGFSSPPLVVDDFLIVAPGAKDASVAALNKRTGKVVWKTSGHAAAYSAFQSRTFGGKHQIIGYDVAGLAGWDVKTGMRLWEVIPEGLTDFNVGTPVIIENRLLVATENNETRIYQFDAKGILNPKPIAVNHDLAPDTCSPVIHNSRVFCSAYGQLYCLDWKNSLKTIWDTQGDDFYEHTNIIAGNNRLLIWTSGAELLLVAADTDEYKLLQKIKPFEGKRNESMAHPALMKGRIYLRNSKKLKCLKLPSK